MVAVQLNIKEDGKERIDTLTVPASWNECSLDQLLYIADHWQAYKQLAKSKLDLSKAKALLFLRLSETLFGNKMRLDTMTELGDQELWDLTQLTNFVFESNTLTKCPLPRVRLGFHSYYAPNDGLGNIKASEFHFADLFFMQYSETGSEESLINLIATIYRPAKRFTKGIRVPFNHELIEDYAKHLKRLSYAQKQLILLWYIGCREAMIEANKDLFSKPNENEAQSGRGWLPLIMALSGDKFGTFEQTGLTDFALILMEIREANERAPKKQ